MAEPLGYEQWVALHESTFKQHNFPTEKLGKALYEKLKGVIADKPDNFEVRQDTGLELIYTPANGRILESESDVFAVPHIWSDDTSKFSQKWKTDKSFRESLLPFCKERRVTPKYVPISELPHDFLIKSLRINVDSTFDASALSNVYPGLEDLGLSGDSQSQIDEILRTIHTLKAISCDSKSVDVLQFKNIEIFNRSFTENYTEWALLNTCGSEDPETVAKLDLSHRGISKLSENAFKRFRNLTVLDVRGNSVDTKNILSIIPSLLSLYCDGEAPSELVFINGTDSRTGDISMPIPDAIWDHMQVTGADWALGNTTSLAIRHSIHPNFASMPAGSPIIGSTFFVFWPISEVKAGDSVSSNLFPNISFDEVESKPFVPHQLINLKSAFKSTVTKKRPVKAFIEYEPFVTNLHSPFFEVTKDANSADLLWLTAHQTADFTPIYTNGIMFNQIENERFLTVKDLLYQTVVEAIGPAKWLPETFILSNPGDVAKFLAAHEKLKASGQSPAWIVKAFNQTRAEHMIVSESPSEVLRHATTGYRLAQRYIWNPLNIYGMKFDLRFIVLLKSIKPFELYAYKVFWPRLSPKLWAPEDFADYERHFTVMNYRAPNKVTHKTWVDFVEQFGIENPKWKWEDVLKRVYAVIRDLFVCGCQKMVQSPYCKAMYGIDLMITKDMEPVILECNFQPDCKRACNLCPTFVDDVFEVLYIDQPVKNDKVARIPLE